MQNTGYNDGAPDGMNDMLRRFFGDQFEFRGPAAVPICPGSKELARGSL
jgi:hypothetical protein